MAWAHVQSVSKAATGTSGSSATVTPTTANLSSGTKLIIAIGWASGSTQTVTSVKDASSNAFTKMVSAPNSGGPSGCDLWQLDTPAGDVGTKPVITVQFSGSVQASLLLQEVSGLATGTTTAAVLDGTAGTKTGAGGSSTGSPTYSSSVSNEYLVTVYGDDGGPETLGTPTPPGTKDAATVSANSDADVGIGYGNSTGTTEAGSWPLSGSSAEWGVILVAFKLASGGSASVTGVVATATATAAAGSIDADATITGVVATATTAAPAGSVGTGQSVTGVVATATATAAAGSLSAGADISGAVATATATAHAGSLSAGVTIAGAVATATTTAPAGAAIIGESVTGVVATATATAPAGSVHAGATITGVVATAMAVAPPGAVPAAVAPAFPQAPLGTMVELDVNGWTDVTSDVYARSDIAITRGRQDESTTTQPAQLTCTLGNRTGNFSSKNPLGAYYPYLGRNTPIRVSVPEQTTYLRVEVDNSSYAQTPDSSGLSITGDTELQLDVSLDNWRADQILAAKWADTSNERSWLLLLNEDGTLTFAWSANGTSVISATSDAAAPWPPLRRQALRVTLATSTGTVTFYTGPPGLSSPSWTQLGDPIIEGSADVFDSTAPVQLGSATDAATEAADYGGIYGKIWGFQLLSGIGGTVEASPDWTSATAGASTLTDTQGNVWTCEGTSEISGRKYRFHGELSAVPQAWDETGSDVWCDIQAAGILRRLGQNTETLGSAFTRALPSAVGLVGYWTCEDGNTTSYGTTPATPTQFASAIPGVAAGTFTGTPDFASNEEFLCSESLPVISGSRWHFRLPSRGADTANVMRFLMQVPSTDDTDTGIVARMYTTGTIGQLVLQYGQINSGSLQLVGYDQTGTQLFATGYIDFSADGVPINGSPVWVSMELRTSGSSVAYSITILEVGATTGFASSGTQSSASVGNATNLVINGDLTHSLQGTSVGQITYQNEWQSLFDFGSQLDAWQGEAAGIRFQRLCGEQGIPFRAVGSLDDTIAMGAQTTLALTDLLQECVDADRGAMYEPREAVALGYRTRASMQNQSAGITLDYSQAVLAQPVQVTEDDQYTKNDIAVTRAYAPGGGTGSSYQAVLDTGALSIQAPPNGVGDYPDSETINLDLDSQLPDAAGWILWLGTVDDPRYPQIMVDLARQEMLADTTLWYGVQDLDLDDRLTVTNLPLWLPPDGITQLANGVTETLNAFKYTISWCCVPELPYETGIIGDDVLGRIDTDGSVLHADYTYGGPSIEVDTLAGTPTVYWTLDPDDCPFDILISGMRLTVLAISGTSSPQTFTVVPGVNGVVKNLATGDDVRLFTPMIFSPGELGASGGASLTPIYINSLTVHTASASENAVPGKVYIVDTTGGTVTMQLPSAASVPPGSAIVVKNPSGANDVILKPVSGETINGLPNANISGGVHLSQGGQGRWIMPAPGGWESF